MSRPIFKTCATLLAITVMGCGPTRSQTATTATSPQQKEGRPVEIALWPQGLAITSPSSKRPE